jgi:hypothetical protein
MVITNPLSYQEAGVNLHAICITQGVRSRDIDAPIEIVDQALLSQRPVKVQVSADDITVWLRGEEIFHQERGPLITRRKWNEEIDHLRHNYVASLLQDTTDDKLSDIGVNSNLTPDKISPDKRTVLELATTVSNRALKIEEDYQGKVLAYRQVCHDNGLKLTVLCVSSTRVFTNCCMRHDMIPELCRRLREAASFELDIATQTGRMPNQVSEEGDHGVETVKDIMSGLSKLTKNIAWDFNEQLADLSLEPSTEGDTLEAARILGETWKISSSMEKRKPESSLDDYCRSLRNKKTRSDQKRVLPFPCVIPQYSAARASEDDFGMLEESRVSRPEARAIAHLFRLGIANSGYEADSVPEGVHRIKSLSEAMQPSIIEEPGKLRRLFSYDDTLSEQELDTIALSGPGAKLRKEMTEVIEHEKAQKVSFDLECPTGDIDTFLTDETLTDHDSSMREKNNIYRMIKASSKERKRGNLSKKLNEWCLDLGTSRFSHFISELCLELSYEYKQPHKVKQWTCKPMRNYNVFILLKSTGSHLFFSLAGKTESSELWDCGRLGPEVFFSGDVWFSDFCSVVEASLDHYIKAGPYIVSITAYLMQHFKIPFITREIIIPPEFWQTLKSLFLIYFNNKVDLENLILDCRYLYMKILQKFEGDPYVFIEKLPGVLRSRLTAYFLKKVLRLMRRYRSTPPGQVRMSRLPESDPNSVRITGLRCIFHSAPIQLDQLIDTFYFSYTISKMKGKVGDRSLKIITKVVKEEMWAREHIREVKNCLWNDVKTPERQSWSAPLLAKMIDLLKTKWKLLYGPNHVELLNRKIAQDMFRVKFSDISTLKASSKDMENPEINLPENKEGALTGKAYVQALKQLNPRLQGKRPRVITALIRLIKEYATISEDRNPTLLNIMPFCLKKLLNRGFIFSDCFPKDQHGGDREIHVLEIAARVVQFFVEKAARCMGYLFRSDTVLNPKRKESFMKEHEIFAQAQLGTHMTLCKSADASKWCQRHHVSKFYFAMNRLTDGFFDGLFYNVFYLWTVKRLAIPEELVSILDSSKFVESDNDILLWLRQQFLAGAMPFVAERSNTLEIKFGMWQGIFQMVGTVIHSICQEFYAALVRQKTRERGMNVVVTVVQGSDDSACCISYTGKGLVTEAYVHILLKWKEEFQKFLSIWPSEPKSSIGTQLLVEYNSEWWFRGKIIKPTFRWVSACLETSIVETFHERMQIFYNGLTTAVEVGLSTLAASVIQKSQAWLHYLMLGLGNHILREMVADLLQEVPHPALGYFPIDEEEHCGITGFEYSLFVLTKERGIPIADVSSEMINPSTLLDYDERVDKSVRKDLKRVFVGFGNQRLWEQVVEEMDIGVLDDALLEINKTPSMLYQEGPNWREQRVQMILKLFQKGVRTSLSSYQPTIRSAVSSAYLFNRPCVWSSLNADSARVKMSLLQAILAARGVLRVSNHNNQSKLTDRDSADEVPLFVHEQEYEDFYSYIQDLRTGYSFQEVPYGRHSKVCVPVWGDLHMHDTPLIDICKRALFDLKSVKMASSSFKMLWSECKAKYRFLRDSYEETREVCGMDHMQLHDFLHSASSKIRKVTLQDTNAKNPSLIGSMSRIFWPQVKVRARPQAIEENISNLRHLLMCTFSFHFSKKHKMRVMKQLMHKSSLRDRPLHSCPNRAKKLKIICDFVMTQSKERALADIPRVRQGLIGFFLQAQERQVGPNRTTRFWGKGVWVGSVCGIPTRIDIMDDYVEMITIQSMHDTVSLSKRLLSLLGELRQQAPLMPRRSTSLYYLNPKGHFLVSPLALSDCICVEVEPELAIPEMANLLEKPWDVEIDNTTVRVVCLEKVAGERDRKITLIGDTFTRRDWNPDLTPKDLKWTRSTTFQKYCSGDSAGMYEIIADLGLDMSKSYTKDVLSRAANKDQDIGVYSLSQLSNNLRSYIVSSEGSRAAQAEDLMSKVAGLEESNRVVEVDEADLEAILSFGEDQFANPAEEFDWADDGQEEWEKAHPEETFVGQHEKVVRDQPKFLDQTEEDVLEDLQWSGTAELSENLAELFFDLDMDDSGISTRNFEILRQMPNENQYWLDLINTVKSETYGHSILESVWKQAPVKEEAFLVSHGAFFLSLITQRNLYSSGGGRSPSETEVSLSMSTRDPMVAKEDIQTHKIELHSKISDIDNSISTAQGYVLELLKKKKGELEVQLRAYEDNSSDFYDESIRYYDFMSQLLGKLREGGWYDKTEYSTELDTLVTLLLSDVLESSIERNKFKQISDSDLMTIRSRIWDRLYSSSLVRYISKALNISISVHKDGIKTYESIIPLSPATISLSFSS